VAKNLNSGTRPIKGRKLSRGLYLVGLSGEHRLDLVRTWRWSRSILRTGAGRIATSQRKLLGVRRMSRWRAWVRNVDGKVKGCILGDTVYAYIMLYISISLQG